MKTIRSQKNGWGIPAAALTVWAGLLLATTPALAAKPGGGGSTTIDTGTIYYYRPQAKQVWAMNPDGTGKKVVLEDNALPGSALSVQLDVSRARHGGSRWFLTLVEIPGETYPDGRLRLELFALGENGARVQLTSDPAVQPNIDDTLGWVDLFAFPRWAPRNDLDLGLIQDGTVSYLARRWDLEANTIVETGLFVICLLPDQDLLDPGFVPMQPTRMNTVNLPQRPDANGYPSLPVGDCDWSPDGSMVVYQDYEISAGLHIVSVNDGLTWQLTPDFVCAPRWSPVLKDGTTRISFESGGGSLAHIDSINPDGTGRVTVIPPPSKASTTNGRSVYRQVEWSPKGINAVYSMLTITRTGSGYLDVYRAPLDGTTGVNLTQNTTWSDIPLGWRAEP